VIPFFYVTSSVGIIFGLTAFIVVVIGGFGSMWGAFVGALIIGVVESVTEIALAPSLKQIGSLLIFLLVLYLRPQGLFGKKAERY
jgi:branched-chain amino acid transport system permease protein